MANKYIHDHDYYIYRLHDVSMDHKCTQSVTRSSQTYADLYSVACTSDSFNNSHHNNNNIVICQYTAVFLVQTKLSELFFQSPGRYTQTIICIPLLRRLCSVHAKFSMTSLDTLEKSNKKTLLDSLPTKGELLS